MDSIGQHIVSKWQPIIENIFNIKNKLLFEHICNYCEWKSTTGNHNGFTKAINEIKDKIDNSKRVGIVRNVFNIFTYRRI